MHSSLCETPIICKQKYNDNYKISLSNICIDSFDYNPIEFNKHGIKYFLRNDNKTGEILISVKSSPEKTIKQSEFGKDALLQNNDYLKLSNTQKGIIESVYDKLNPWQATNLLFDDARDNSKDIIKCGTIDFTSDRELLAKGLIECIYLLRNSLLHGELTPNGRTVEVYEYAYNILSTIIKRMK